MLSRRRAQHLRRERVAAEHIPYTAHVADAVVKTGAGDYVLAFRLGGASFESADDETLNSWHERLNVLWRNLASPNIAVWTHLVRRPLHAPPPAAAGEGFAALLAAKYRERLAGETLMVNELYLALCYRPVAGVAVGLAARLLARTQGAPAAAELSDALDNCAKLAQTVQAALARYEPEALGTYCCGPHRCSALLEYLALLVNGERRRVPLPQGPLAEALVTTRLLFGSEAIEYRLPARTRVAAMLGIKEYPTPSSVGMFNRLLSAPFALVLTQSFSFLSRPAGQALLQRQHVRFTNAGDFAVSQAAQLKQALDALSSNEFVMGDHHLSLQVLTELPGGFAAAPPSTRLGELNDRVALARNILADTGMTVAREDLAVEAAFWAQLPGNFPMRTRKAPITSRNFAAMFGSIRSVAGSAAAALEFLQAQRARSFSVRQWVQSGHGVLFIPYRASQIAALRSIIATWVRLAIFQALDGAQHDQRLWFVVDELDSLGAIDGLKDALARLRKFGGRCVLGFQSIAQVSGTYGGEAQTIVENCATTLILRCSGSEHGGTSQFAARLIGEREVLRRQTSRGRDREAWFGTRGARRSTSVSQQHVTEAAVLASQLEQLPDFTGYLKTAAYPQWLRVHVRRGR